MNKPSIRVSAAILERDGKILICRRQKGGSCGDLWEFPGGKIELGETPEECLIRECREELGVDIQITGTFGQAHHCYPDVDVTLYFYRGGILQGEPRRTVHQEMAWVVPTELKRYDFCPADEEVIANLSKKGK
ncbi:MAG: 8-oxo-dGTP diphosphatase MutT [Bacillota bacterium]|nr:8-oxo-dGTP diphosphatase MutT [Bacillota bacterium]